MERRYYSRQNYNQLKRKQYEEYIKRQNMYYIYIRKYYEEYVKNQNKYYLDKKKYYEEYVKRQNMYYIYIKKYYEEYIKNQNKYYLDEKKYYEEYVKRQNKYYLSKKKYDEEHHKRTNDISANKRKGDKTDNSQSKFFSSVKAGSIEENNINDYSIKNNIYDSLEANIEENNLEYKKAEENVEEKAEKYVEEKDEEYVEEKAEEYVEKKAEENVEEKVEENVEEKAEEYVEEKAEEYVEEKAEEYVEKKAEENVEEKTEENVEEKAEEYVEEKDEEYVEEKAEEYVEEKAEEYVEEKAEEYVEEKAEEYVEEKAEEYVEEKAEEYIEEKAEEFFGEDYNAFVKEKLYKETNISTEGLYVKFPVILAETDITIPIEATITLDQEAIEIKGIKKNLFLTQSHLVPFSSSAIDPNSGILFIAGFIRENIEYKTKTCDTEATKNVCGNIRYCTVEVPFNFTTRITFLRSPILIEKPKTRELEFLTEKLQFCDSCEDLVIGRDPYEQSFVFSEIFNEKPFVELVKVTFIEADIHKNSSLNYETPEKKEFSQITEKIIINLTLKVLQKQQLKVAIEY